MKHSVLYMIASIISARAVNLARGNQERVDDWEEKLVQIIKDFLPHGSGVDNGVDIDLSYSNHNRVKLTCGFHHMTGNGYYDGWTQHSIILTPSFTSQCDMKITGRDRNNIKEYLGQLFDNSLGQIIIWNEEEKKYVRSN
jgi:hypothetical protein